MDRQCKGINIPMLETDCSNPFITVTNNYHKKGASIKVCVEKSCECED